MTFSGSTAIVTGGASGIGLAITERLALDGAKVSVFDIDLEQAERAAEDVRDKGGEAIACQVDVSDRSQVDAAVERTRRELGPVLVLVNGAGKDSFDRFVDISTELWERVIAVNLTGTFHCTQAALPDMLAAKWGRIVNISSSSGQTGAVMMAPYSSSKAGRDRPDEDAGARARAPRHHRQHHPARRHRHADEPPCRRGRALRRRHAGRRRSPPAGAPHRACPRTSPPRARTSCPTRPAT